MDHSQDSCIYHNICCPHRLRGPQGVSDGEPAKQATNHPKTRQKRAGSVFRGPLGKGKISYAKAVF
ncbi:TPA: hypothetical protein MIS53_27390 [Klebsiella pneumoniae]|nr:hypothetical protein [Klebsiella pneumoniae]